MQLKQHKYIVYFLRNIYNKTEERLIGCTLVHIYNLGQLTYVGGWTETKSVIKCLYVLR